MQSHSVYIHIPFCQHRCAYCDFNTYAGLEELYSDYVRALIREISSFSQSFVHPFSVHTVFFGGGTPSLLPSKDIALILEALGNYFSLAPDAEITLEANPGTVDQQYLSEIRKLGINRLSIGMQSANPEELALLERNHGFEDVIQAVKYARIENFQNINLDLIFALPGQRIENWQRNIQLAFDLNPEHLALYALSFEHNTPFTHMLNRGLIRMPDSDLAADMFLFAEESLQRAAYSHYEISNWARQSKTGRNFACLHNLQYWRNLPWIGFGAGAHGWLMGRRTVNVLGPDAYIERLRNNKAHAIHATSATISAEKISRKMEMSETMMMGLRLLEEGVSPERFKTRFGKSLSEVFGPQIKHLKEQGLLERSPSTKDPLRITQKGRLLANRIFQEFV